VGDDFLGSQNGVGVDADSVFYAAGVAAGQCCGDRDIAGTCQLENAFVAGFQAGFGET
jgi:hypothetical protein